MSTIFPLDGGRRQMGVKLKKDSLIEVFAVSLTPKSQPPDPNILVPNTQDPVPSFPLILPFSRKGEKRHLGIPENPPPFSLSPVSTSG